MVFEHSNYRSFLKSVLAEKMANNPRFSLRAMAQFLGLQPSQLSEIHQGSKNLSLDRAAVVAKKLGLNDRESEYFCLLVQQETAKSHAQKEATIRRMGELNPKRQVHDLSVDLFKVISDWYHAPILEMTTLKGFKFSARSVAKRLGITPLEAEVAIERLQRLELLEVTKDGKYVKTHGNTLVESHLPNEALRAFNRQILNRAIESITTQTPQEKFIGSETIAVDLAQLPRAKEMIEEFFSKMVTFLSSGTNKTEVMNLGVQMFKLTEKGN